MELKDFKLPEGVEVDFKPDTVTDEDKNFADYFNNLPAEERKGIFSGKLKRSLEIDWLNLETETVELSEEYDENDEYEEVPSVIGKIVDKIRGIFK